MTEITSAFFKVLVHLSKMGTEIALADSSYEGSRIFSDAGAKIPKTHYHRKFVVSIILKPL